MYNFSLFLKNYNKILKNPKTEYLTYKIQNQISRILKIYKRIVFLKKFIKLHAIM